MAGEAVGSMLFGLLAILAAFVLVGRLEREHKAVSPDPLASAPVPLTVPVNREPPL